MQVIFNLADIPEQLKSDMAEQIEGFSDYRQLLLIGHGGKRMWEAVQASQFRDTHDPIDSFSVDRLKSWFSDHYPSCKYKIIYPDRQRIVALQSLGELVGWHHRSPFRIGINQLWGSWFAYRLAVLCDSSFEVSEAMRFISPCETCIEKPCITACPADALQGCDFSLKRCINHRLSSDSSCHDQCLARLSCPVAPQPRYTTQQINYHYCRSLQSIQEYYRDK